MADCGKGELPLKARKKTSPKKRGKAAVEDKTGIDSSGKSVPHSDEGNGADNDKTPIKTEEEQASKIGLSNESLDA